MVALVTAQQSARFTETGMSLKHDVIKAHTPYCITENIPTGLVRDVSSLLFCAGGRAEQRCSASLLQVQIAKALCVSATVLYVHPNLACSLHCSFIDIRGSLWSPSIDSVCQGASFVQSPVIEPVASKNRSMNFFHDTSRRHFSPKT